MELRVLDSNILLEDAYSIVSQGSKDVTIVIPETVLDEVESKKMGLTELSWQAREFGRLMSKAQRTGILKASYGSLTTLVLDGTPIWVVALSNYQIPRGLDQKNINDYKIINVAKTLSEHYTTTLVTNDVGCSLKAEALGIKVSSVKHVEKTEYEYIKHLSVDFNVFSNIDNSVATTINPGHTKENYSYIFSSPDTNQVKLAYVDQTGKLKVMGKAVDKELNNQAMPPMNAGQKFLSRAILDPTIDVVVCEAKAGSGKTITAISSAMRLVSTNNPYDSIIYIRASVDDLEKEEQVGFLPGLQEKFDVYLHPMADSLEAIARKSNNNSKLSGAALEDKIQEDIIKLQNKFRIESMITLGMRGRTFSNAVIIIDEAQNMSKSSLQKVITRFGKNTKVIIIGSNRQIDHAFINKYNNGLSLILENCTQENDHITLFATHLDRVVRSPIAEWAEGLFSAQ